MEDLDKVNHIVQNTLHIIILFETVQIAYDFEGGNVSQIFQMENCEAAIGSFIQFGAGVSDIVIQYEPHALYII